MLYKLLIHCFIFATSVAIGCSSSSTTGKDGGAGKGGSGGGTAGAAGGTAGAAGGTAGAAGGTAGAAGGTAGAAGSTAGHDGGTDATGTAGSDGGSSDSGGEIPACPAGSTSPNFADKLEAATFCKNFLATCSGL